MEFIQQVCDDIVYCAGFIAGFTQGLVRWLLGLDDEDWE